MFDGKIRSLIDPMLDSVGRKIAGLGIRANHLSLAGLAAGLAMGGAVSQGAFALALVMLAVSRLADGLDGAVARARARTDFGGFLDIVCDYGFYAALPLGFVFLDPAANGLPGAALLAAFYINGGSFLGYAILAERFGMSTSIHGKKSLYFTGGLAEGGETIAFFVAMLIWPQGFGPLAYGFAGLCLITALSRILQARAVFSKGL